MREAHDLTIYGIANCDKVRAVMKWCREHGLPCQLHDYRRDGLDEALLDQLLQQFPFDALLNKRSSTWRTLAEERKQHPDKSLLREYPTLIKRPIVHWQENWLLAATPGQLEELME